MKKFLFPLYCIVSACLVSSCSDKQATVELTPTPLSCTVDNGTFNWNNDTWITLKGSGIDSTIINTAFKSSGQLPVQYAKTVPERNMILLERVEQLPTVHHPEGYTLTVRPETISIQATSDAGLFYGVQTLLQLAKAGGGKVQAVTIADEPRFEYRGIMLDVSRHFRTIDFLKKQIDLLASYKINRLHLHLTDGAGWRLEIKQYPRLTEFAAWRKPATWKAWWEGERQYCEQTDPEAYGGYYTQDQIRELLEYARLRCVTIIPEIEMPSHSEEVLTAYPELSCTHEPYKQGDFCIGNEKTFEFLENVLSEVVELFPSQYIHIGGDEASKASWKTCPLCQARMKKEGLKDVDELQSYLIHRIERFLNAKGKTLLGWDEILQGGVAPNAAVMSWRGEEGGIKAVRDGHPAIMTPGEYCYFDAYQDAPYSQPEAIGGYLPLNKMYGYDPVPDSLSQEEAKLIKGVQGNLFAEYTPTDEHMEYMLYPRAIALAEVAWTQPANKSWDSFRQRILKIIPEIKAKGYNTFDYSQEIGNRKEALEPIEHLAKDKPVTFNIPYWENYPANGAKTLTDGLRGGWNYNDKRWLGYVKDMDVVIDLGEETTLHSIGADFMQICGPYVYMPAQVIISVSQDGKEYSELTKIDHKIVKDDAVSFKNFGWTGETSARYVRYQAMQGDIQGSVLFVDEIVVK